MSPSFKIRPAKIKHNWGTGALNLADTSCLNWKKIINVNIYREIVLLILQINTSNIVVVGSVSMVSLLFEVFTTTFIFELLPSLSSAIIGKYFTRNWCPVFYRWACFSRWRLGRKLGTQDGAHVPINFKVSPLFSVVYRRLSYVQSTPDNSNLQGK